MPVSTVSSVFPRKTSPSTVSNESSSLRPDATSGRYQPTGGAGLLTRMRPSRMPRRWRMRPMVRLEGTRTIRCSIIDARMASAPQSPRSLPASSRRRRSTSSSTELLVRLTGLGAPERRSLQSTRSSRVPDARSTHRRTVSRLTPNSRATPRNERPRRTACTITRRTCSSDFCAHGLSHFSLEHINPLQPLYREPGYGSCQAMESPPEDGGLPTAFGKRPPSPTRVSHSSHSPRQRPEVDPSSKPQTLDLLPDVTWGCWHLSDLGLVALGPSVLSPQHSVVNRDP